MLFGEKSQETQKDHISDWLYKPNECDCLKEGRGICQQKLQFAQISSGRTRTAT